MDSRDKKGRQGQYRDKQGKTAIVMARSRKTKSSIIPHCPCLFPAWFVPFFCCSAVVPSCSCVFPVMYFLALFLFYLWFLGAASLPLTIPSTRNLFFLLHGVFNNVRMMFCGAGFLLNFPSPGISSFFDMDNALSSIWQEASFHLPFFITCSWTGDLSFIPFTGTLTEVLTLHFLAKSSWQVVSSASALITDSFFTDYNDDFQQYL